MALAAKWRYFRLYLNRCDHVIYRTITARTLKSSRDIALQLLRALMNGGTLAETFFFMKLFREHLAGKSIRV